MEYGVKTGSPETQRSACLIVAVFEGGKLSKAASMIDKASGGTISKIIKRGDLKGKVAQTLLLHNLPDISAERVLLVGCGAEKSLTETDYKKALSKAINEIKNTHAKDVLCYLPECKIKGRDYNWMIRQAVISSDDALYTFDQLKSKKENNQTHLRKITFASTEADKTKQANDAVKQGTAIAAGIKLCKDLGNLPGNICTPNYLAEQGKSLANEHKSIKTKILEEADMERLGMGALLSVSRGSRQPAKLIIMEYKGGKKGDKPVVLVGKGLTFDSGGISIKPSASMDEMKYDMCGGASVFGTIKAIAEMNLPINVTGVVPSSENMPDGDANKPGDIVTSLSGQTIEILNTDAEGRLILCDALTYSERLHPELVIDIATLTGACVIALGSHASALYSNHEPLAKSISKAANTSTDRVWQMPLWEDYQEQLKSNFADMANVGGREAGSITAACFLARYTKQFHWAHLDIAGSAWNSGGNKGSTGRPVPLLTEFLIQHSESKG